MARSVSSNVTMLPATNEFGHRLDPNDWHFDARTGQYLFITDRNKRSGQYLADRTPYEMRLIRYEKAQIDHDKNVKAVFIWFAVSAASVVPLFLIQNVLGWLAMGFLDTCVLLALGGGVIECMMTGSELSTARKRLGPAPVQPTVQNDVHTQAIYGEEVWLEGSALEAAARGGVSPAAGSPNNHRPRIRD